MIHWNASPELISFGPITIRWYGILFAAAFLLGFQIMQWIYKKEKRSVTELDSLFMFMFIGTIVGARLGHCLFYDPAFYLSHPIEIFKIWKGGLASHGGAIGILLSLYFYTRKQGNLSYLWLLDRLAIPTALGGTFIRIGNFMNSEIVGIPTNGWWAVVFERVDMIPRHAVQLYEATAYGIVFIVLLLSYFA